jgi:hypothetical protein
MDNALIFFLCATFEGRILKDILELFCDAIGFIINFNKFVIYFPSIEEDSILVFSIFFNFPFYELGDGINTLVMFSNQITMEFHIGNGYYLRLSGESIDGVIGGSLEVEY